MNVKCDFYHSKKSASDKTQVFQKWLSDEI